jgi:hypothetical protein
MACYGMSLAIGHCYRELWRKIGNGDFISESSVALAGVRALDSKEHLENLKLRLLQSVR